jgi:hypothetical protein
MDLNAMVEWLTGTQEGQAVAAATAAKEEDRRLAEREGWARQIRIANEQYEKLSPPLIATEQRTAQALEETKKKAADMIRDAERIHTEAKRARQKAGEDRDRDTLPAQAHLRRTASPKIIEFARELETRRRTLSVNNEWGRVAASSTGEGVIASSADSVKAIVVRINEILCSEIARLELEPVSDEELEERFEALRRSIPQVEMRPVEYKASLA